jgi:hypothetical protein
VTFEEVIQELSEWLDERKPNEPLIRLDNWAAMADMTYREFFSIGRRKPYAPVLKRYFAAIRAWRDAVHAALHDIGVNDITYLREVAAHFGVPEKTIRGKAQRLGLAPSNKKQKISVERCLEVAKVGMTLDELAAASGYKDHSLANLVPRNGFKGKIIFAVRVTDSPRGRRPRLVIIEVRKK